jgi:succinate dehydrogenase hydrophobic anchor subunit
VSAAVAQPRLVAFLVMRATAVLLAVLVLGHFAVTHLVTDVADTSSSFVLRRWSSALWLAWDWTMLAAALAHAGTGLWLMVEEQAASARTRRRRQVGVAVTVGVLLAVGTTAIAAAGIRGSG